MVRVPHDDPRKLIPAPAGYVRFLLRRFGTTEALKAQLVEGTDIDEARLQDPGAEVTLFTFVTLSQNLTRVVGETWPLDAMAAWSNAMQGALEVAVRSAPTVGDAFETIHRFGHVRAPFLEIGLRRDKDGLRLECRNIVDIEPATWRSLSLTVMLGMTGMISPLLEGRDPLLKVTVPWPAPRHVDRIRDAVGVSISFGGKAFSLALPRDVCGEPSPFADERLHATAVTELEATSRRMTAANEILLRVQELFARKRTGRLNEDEAAHALGMSRRTLVRRLGEGGTSFRRLLDADLKRRARVMLDDASLSRTQMADALGFADPTSFSRACRRWFGGED